MANITFNKLLITDWRASNKTIKFTNRTKIQGRNGTGKSTVWDALMWLFTGYDSSNRLNFELFDNKVEPTYENSKPASVELFFNKDGYDYRLKRTARMGWTRPRGKETYEKKPSDDYSYEVDGVEVPVSQYTKFIEQNFCPIDKLKFILNIDYYLMLNWKDLRKQFADIIGEVQRTDYVGDFNDGWAYIDRYHSIESARDYLNSQKKTFIKSIGDGNYKGEKTIELETLERELPDISDLKSLKVEYEDIKSKIKGLDDVKSSRFSINDDIKQKRYSILSEIDQLEDDLNDKKYHYELEQNHQVAKLEHELDDLQHKNRLIQQENDDLDKYVTKQKNKIKELDAFVKVCEENHAHLTKRVGEIKNIQFTADRCAFCGASLEGDNLEKAKNDFQKEVQSKLDRVMSEGKANRQKWNQALADIDSINRQLDMTPNFEPLVSEEELKAKISDLRKSFIPYEETIQSKEILAKIADLRAKTPSLKEVDTEDIDSQLKELRRQEFDIVQALGKEKVYNDKIAYINTLKADIKCTIIELAKVYGVLNQLDNIEKQKAEIIKARVSKLFTLCEVQMEERKKDGEMTPTCNLYLKKVKANVTNTASKILIGADISNAFSKYYQLTMPLIVDNRERIDGDMDMGAINQERQIIELERKDCEFQVV